MLNSLTIKLLIILTAFVSLAAIVGMPMLYFRLRQSETILAAKEKEAIANGDPAAIEKKLSEIIYVPQEETPLVRPADSPQYRGLPFFANAEKEDFAVIYQKSGKIYLFDPVAQKIRDIGVLSTPPPQPTSPVGETPTPTIESVASPSGSTRPSLVPSEPTGKPSL